MKRVVTTHSYLHETQSIYILAHRGGAGTTLHENSLEAFRRSVALGYNYLETDVRLATDGRLYLAHGSSSLLPNRLLKLGKDKIPSLDELFDTFPDSFFAIDPKHARAIAPLAELITDRNMVDQVCIGASFDHRAEKVADLVAQSSGKRPTTALVGFTAILKLLLNAYGLPIGLRQTNASFIHVHYRLVRPRLVRAAHQHNLKLIAWVVNDQQIMEKLLSWQIDGFMTDYPEIATKALESIANRS